jgi:hypothetical protein
LILIHGVVSTALRMQRRLFSATLYAELPVFHRRRGE